MNEMNSLERQLHTWQPRRPSAGRKRRLFTEPVRLMPRMAWFVGWLVPASILIAFVLVAASGRNGSLFLQLNALGPATSDLFWANATVLGDTVVALALCLPLWRRRPDLLWALAIGGLLATI